MLLPGAPASTRVPNAKGAMATPSAPAKRTTAVNQVGWVAPKLDEIAAEGTETIQAKTATRLARSGKDMNPECA